MTSQLPDICVSHVSNSFLQLFSLAFCELPPLELAPFWHFTQFLPSPCLSYPPCNHAELWRSYCMSNQGSFVNEHRLQWSEAADDGTVLIDSRWQIKSMAWFSSIICDSAWNKWRHLHRLAIKERDKNVSPVPSRGALSRDSDHNSNACDTQTSPWKSKIKLNSNNTNTSRSVCTQWA